MSERTTQREGRVLEMLRTGGWPVGCTFAPILAVRVHHAYHAWSCHGLSLAPSRNIAAIGDFCPAISLSPQIESRPAIFFFLRPQLTAQCWHYSGRSIDESSSHCSPKTPADETTCHPGPQRHVVRHRPKSGACRQTVRPLPTPTQRPTTPNSSTQPLWPQ